MAGRKTDEHSFFAISTSRAAVTRSFFYDTRLLMLPAYGYAYLPLGYPLTGDAARSRATPNALFLMMPAS
ncbi:hypothetical protein CCACVL1_29715 [Corchorus capsularis]|uniref:Uncharacterized protein n=1 Tax=Corchorus capsularis TaxID=210143 RepID=A0A1R3G0G4_COCAP|nr:hypothetical protein CCACVL1_29715 [Corchorus capsularis]